MHTHLAIITTKKLKQQRIALARTKVNMSVTYVSEPQRLAMVLSTLYGEGRARLAGNNHGNYVAMIVEFKLSSSFCPFCLIS